MSEESRLGREQIETAYALKQITGAGVRVFFYLEDRERTLETAMDKVMLSLTLGGHLKTGQLWTGQNRPVESCPKRECSTAFVGDRASRTCGRSRGVEGG
jgi:hypothetical protein